jgi:hypothetical protein
MRVNPATLTVSNKSICSRRRFFHPRQQNAAARDEPGSHGKELRWRAAFNVDVGMVSVVEVVPGGVTVAGEKLPAAPTAENVIVELNP